MLRSVGEAWRWTEYEQGVRNEPRDARRVDQYDRENKASQRSPQTL
jgi:hypothetical protein